MLCDYLDAFIGSESAEHESAGIRSLARAVGSGLFQLSGRSATSLCFVPGRIEVLGKHTDYAGGRSLTCATERGVCIGASPRTDGVLVIRDVGRGVEAQLDLTESGALDGFEDWRRYPAVVARRLASDFGRALGGANVVLCGDLPPAAGLSSSSALVIAFFVSLAAANGRIAESLASMLAGQIELAEYLGAVESGMVYRGRGGGSGVGTFGGSEDHVAILCSRPDELRSYRYTPVVPEGSVRLTDELCFAIAVSGVRASKAANVREAFNRLAELAAAGATLWRTESSERDPHLGAAIRRAGVAAVREAIARGAGDSRRPSELLGRFDHFAVESESLVPEGLAALESASWERFGEVVDRSQALAEEILGNQTPETILLARNARENGALAASAFGAGFGGSVWALVDRESAESFVDQWRAAYTRAFPGRSSEFFLTRPSAGARRIGI